MRSDFAMLESNGYCLLKVDNTDSFLKLGAELGEPIASRKNSTEFVDFLTVSTTRNDRSLSSKFKSNAFPYHSDGAYLSIPPRYVLLRSESFQLGCPTILCPLNLTESERIVLKRDSWFVNGGRGKFYASILSNRNGEDLIRYDLECMRSVLPRNASLALMKEIIDKNEKLRIEWEQNLVLIIDNWKMLHARADATAFQGRRLQRIWINS